MNTAPWLLLAVGNPSRGDDALGPLLLERLRDEGVARDGDVELLTDFQLQIEHALDLRGRRGVLFIDAARPGAVTGARLVPIVADAEPVTSSHALRAEAVLRVAEQLDGTVAPSWLLAIEGARFELGSGLSEAAAVHLDDAHALALAWLRRQQRRQACVAASGC